MLKNFLTENNIHFAENCSLAEMTTFRIGGNAKLVIYPDTVEKVSDLVAFLSKNNFDDNTIKMENINRDFPDEEEYLHKDKNQVFSIAKDNALEIANPVIVAFVKYAIREKKFDFTISEIINKANLMCTPTQLGKLLNTQKDLLEQEGLHISKYRTTEGRMYHIDYEEPSLENE